MARKLSSLFAKTGRQAAQAYSSGGNIPLATRDLEKELMAVFTAQYGSVIDTFAGRVTGDRKEAFTFQFLVDRFLRRHGASAVTGVAVTTQFHIRRAIQAGEDEGLGVDKTAKLITERTSGAIGRARAATIARTETHAAASYATDEATKQLNLPNQKKRWVSVGDARTRPSHAAANGQEVLIDEAFLIRDKGAVIAMKYPHDGNGGASNNINCRCLAVYYTEEDDLLDDSKPSFAPVEGGAVADDPKPTVENFFRPRDKAINAATLVIPTKKNALKEMQDSVEEANKDDIYQETFEIFVGLQVHKGPFVGHWQGRNDKDNGRVSLSGFSKESVAYVNQGSKELNAMADWLGISRIRGYKTTGRASDNGNQGGGVMALNKKAINAYVSVSNADLKSVTQILEGLDKQKINYREAQSSLVGYRNRRDAPDYDPDREDELFIAYIEEQKKYNALLEEYSLSKELIARGGGVTTYQRGDNFSTAPWSAKEYFSDGLDKTRVLMYHEFAHHVHQTYKLTGLYNVGAAPLEKRLISFFKNNSKNNLEAFAPSRYSMTNYREYFAESYAMYMMDKAEDLHPEMIEIIKDILQERGK
jgi:hypothetical protein